MSSHVLICHLYIFFSEISLVSFAHFLIELFFDGYFILRILGTSLFSYIWFANIFSHLLTFYFYLLNKFFHRESCLMLINSDLSVFPLMDDTLMLILKTLSEKAMATHPSTLAWKMPWMEEPGSLAVHGIAKSWTQLSDFTFTFHFHALEKEMATHSSVLAWRNPGTGESGGLLSMGSHRVRQNWSDLPAAAKNSLPSTRSW